MKQLFQVLMIFCLTLSVQADKIDKLIKEEMERHEIPGLVLTIIQNGKRTKTMGYGIANLEHKVPVTKDTVFEIGSVTKQFTAAGIMLLAQDGKLSVDDKISKHLQNTPPAWSNITIRHLLTHTSGVKTYTVIEKGFELTEHLDRERFIKLIGAYPLDFPPGEKYSYSNSGYSLLGYIIQSVSGKNYWDFMGERIFGPLGMTTTTNREPSLIIPNRAAGYEKNKKGVWMNRDYDVTDVFSAGAIVSTVGDLAKWDAALNSDQILSMSSKQQMWTPLKFNNGTTKNYGFGWSLDPIKGHKRIGHSGSTSGFSASFQRFPDEKLTVIVFCNSGESGIATTVAEKIAGTFFGHKNLADAKSK